MSHQLHRSFPFLLSQEGSFYDSHKLSTGGPEAQQNAAAHPRFTVSDGSRCGPGSLPPSSRLFLLVLAASQRRLLAQAPLCLSEIQRGDTRHKYYGL